MLCESPFAVCFPVNYLVASQRMLDERLFGPSAACSYTAAYHTLHAFLALKGRVICDPVQWVFPPSVEPPVAAAGILTKDNRWRFEPRTRTHRAKWLEVRDALAPGEVPDAFAYLFSELFRGQRKRGTTARQAINDPAGTRATIEDSWTDLLLLIASIRHAALYSSFGEDPHVVGALWNRDTDTAHGIDRQAKALLTFAALLLTDCTKTLVDISSEIPIPSRLRTWWPVVVNIPWFDLPHVNDLTSSEVRSNLQQLLLWIDPDAPPSDGGA